MGCIIIWRRVWMWSRGENEIIKKRLRYLNWFAFSHLFYFKSCCFEILEKLLSDVSLAIPVLGSVRLLISCQAHSSQDANCWRLVTWRSGWRLSNKIADYIATTWTANFFVNKDIINPSPTITKVCSRRQTTFYSLFFWDRFFFWWHFLFRKHTHGCSTLEKIENQ